MNFCKYQYCRFPLWRNTRRICYMVHYSSVKFLVYIVRFRFYRWNCPQNAMFLCKCLCLVFINLIARLFQLYWSKKETLHCSLNIFIAQNNICNNIDIHSQTIKAQRVGYKFSNLVTTRPQIVKKENLFLTLQTVIL